MSSRTRSKKRVETAQEEKLRRVLEYASKGGPGNQGDMYGKHASWWAMYGKHMPLLASVARRVLAQPVCASAAERNWSVYRKIKDETNSCMGHEVADKRVYCHEALHLKLQSTSYDRRPSRGTQTRTRRARTKRPTWPSEQCCAAAAPSV